MKFINYSLILISCSATLHASLTNVDARKKAIINHPSALSKLEDPINPISVNIVSTAASSAVNIAIPKTILATTYSEINQGPLTPKEKQTLLDADVKLKKEFTRFAQDLSQEPLTNASLQHLAQLKDHEQAFQLKNYISARNREQLAEISTLKTTYRDQWANFQRTTLAHALTEIKNIEKKTKANNHEMMIAQDNLTKANTNFTDSERLKAQIEDLQDQNSMNADSIDHRLSLLESEIANKEQTLQASYFSILNKYQHKDMQVMHAIAPALAQKNKQAIFKTNVKIEVPKKVVKNRTPLTPKSESIVPFKPTVPLDIAAQDSMLDIKIQATKKALKTERDQKHPNLDKIHYFNDQLDFYKKAAQIKNKKTV